MTTGSRILALVTLASREHIHLFIELFIKFYHKADEKAHMPQSVTPRQQMPLLPEEGAVSPRRRPMILPTGFHLGADAVALGYPGAMQTYK